MKRILLVLLAVFAVSISPCAAQQKPDAAGCKDHPLLTRMPNYWIEACTTKEFDGYAFSIGAGKKNQVEGQFWKIRYQPQPGLTPKPSALQLVRNVDSAVKQLGGTMVVTESGQETLKFAKDGNELWLEVWADFTGQYILTIVQKAAMTQNMVGNAAAFAGDLKTIGHVAVNGIYFDTGKSDLKPESNPAIAEVVKLLKGDATLKLYVVGHTDNVGAVEGNMTLSQARAQAVVQALVRGGVDAARLKSYGDGPYAPVASNDAEDGRAKNRRVELVKQ